MKTTQQKQAEFLTLMQENGYILSGKKTSRGHDVYTRTWKRIADIAWYGAKECSLTIEVHEECGYPIARIYQDGHMKDCRDYSSPKRAINALREVVSFAGYKYEEAAI